MSPRVMSDLLHEIHRADNLHQTDYPDGTTLELTPLAEQFKLLCGAKDDTGTVTWADILAEETLESISETDPARLREELIQVAAVALRWVRSLDRREGVPATAPLPDAPPGGVSPARPRPSGPS